MKTIIVTRHPGLLDYLQKHHPELVRDAEVIPHVSDPAQIRGRVVVGVLPLHLAAHAEKVVEVVFEIPADMRGKELTLEQLEQYARGLRAYKVTEVAG